MWRPTLNYAQGFDPGGLVPTAPAFSRVSCVVFRCEGWAWTGMHLNVSPCLFSLQGGPSLEQRFESYYNYCNLFNYILSESEVMMKPSIGRQLFLGGF